MAYDFDRIIERRGTNCAKWDAMAPIYGVSAEDGLAMWVADMDFATPAVITDALHAMADHGVFGYAASDDAYRQAICWWMQTRHGWAVDPAAIFTTNGLVNAVGLCLDAYTQPGDGIVLTTPVYHAFAKAIRRAGREVVECPLALENGRYRFDTDAWAAQMTGTEKMLILCSPHNPGGRVWHQDELADLVAFAEAHDLLILSDEIHQDLTFGTAKHLPLPVAAPEAQARTIVLNAPSKTFNIAGAHVGQVIIPDPELRRAFETRMTALSNQPGTIALEMTRAAYSPEGADWLDALCAYLDENRQLFDTAVTAIPGLNTMPLEATYLSWVDFSGTGMSPEEFTNRVQNDARIAANHGSSFGTGGETFLRFNLATPRSRITEATDRLKAAFADLQ